MKEGKTKIEGIIKRIFICWIMILKIDLLIFNSTVYLNVTILKYEFKFIDKYIFDLITTYRESLLFLFVDVP